MIDFSIEKGKNKEDENKVSYMTKSSFTITYILLLTTATITFIEAMRTQIPSVRHILNLETCISIVAGYFYSVFIVQIEKPYEGLWSDINTKNDGIWKDITKTRYVDWSITTPMMLLTLCLVLGMNSRVPIRISIFLLILFFNYSMLYLGYLGEIGTVDRPTGCFTGFVAFFIMFLIIYHVFVKPGVTTANMVLYIMYFVVWSIYGIVYLFGEESKNVAMNILDLTAKCLIGLGLWAYYTKIFVI
jgi:bacteriorhodopsin